MTRDCDGNKIHSIWTHKTHYSCIHCGRIFKDGAGQ